MARRKKDRRLKSGSDFSFTIDAMSIALSLPAHCKISNLRFSPSPHLRVTLSRYPSFEILQSALSLFHADSRFLPSAFFSLLLTTCYLLCSPNVPLFHQQRFLLLLAYCLRPLTYHLLPLFLTGHLFHQILETLL